MHIEIQNCFSFWGLRPQAPYRGFAPGPHWGTSVPQTPCTGRPPTFVPGLRPWLYLKIYYVYTLTSDDK